MFSVMFVSFWGVMFFVYERRLNVFLFNIDIEKI